MYESSQMHPKSTFSRTSDNASRRSFLRHRIDCVPSCTGRRVDPRSHDVELRRPGIVRGSNQKAGVCRRITGASTDLEITVELRELMVRRYYARRVVAGFGHGPGIRHRGYGQHDELVEVLTSARIIKVGLQVPRIAPMAENVIGPRCHRETRTSIQSAFSVPQFEGVEFFGISPDPRYWKDGWGGGHDGTMIFDAGCNDSLNQVVANRLSSTSLVPILGACSMSTLAKRRAELIYC